MKKKWNLDGPDGWKHYCNGLRKKRRIFSKCQFSGGNDSGIRVLLLQWSGLSGPTKMNSEANKEVLEDDLLTNIANLAGEKWVSLIGNCESSQILTYKNLI